MSRLDGMTDAGLAPASASFDDIASGDGTVHSDATAWQQALEDATPSQDAGVPAEDTVSAASATVAGDALPPSAAAPAPDVPTTPETDPSASGSTAPVTGAANAADLIGKATDQATGKVDTNSLADMVADASRHDTDKALGAYDAIRAKLSPDDAARFDKDVVRVADDAAKGTSTGLGAAGYKALADNPILTKQWEGTTSRWTGKGGFTPGLRTMLESNGIRVPTQVNPSPAGSLSPTSGMSSAQANNTNGALARDAIADRLRAQGHDVQTEVPRQDGARVVDVVADKKAADPRMNERLEIESKVGRTSQSPSIAAQAVKDAEALAENSAVRGTGRALELAGKVVRPVAIVADVAQLGQAFHEDGDRIGDHTGRAASGIAGGWGGAVAGAEGGALLGAAAGSFVPVVGTVAGGVVGGLAGGVGGAIGGDWAGRRAYDWMRSWF